MQVDFYQLLRDPVEQVLPPLAQKIFDDGGRLLVVSADDEQLDSVSQALWNWKSHSFLAHGRAGGEMDSAQPILLSGTVAPANGARMVAIADGVWRDEALRFDRAFYLFAPAATDGARIAWRTLADKADVQRRYWKQDGGKWRQGP